jgi:hypothetical protein
VKDAKKRDEGDRALIEKQRAEQTKRDDGRIKPVTEQERQPEPKR